MTVFPAPAGLGAPMCLSQKGMPDSLPGQPGLILDRTVSWATGSC